MKRVIAASLASVFVFAGCGVFGIQKEVGKAADFVIGRYCKGDTAEQNFVKAKVMAPYESGQVTAFDVKCAPAP